MVTAVDLVGVEEEIDARLRIRHLAGELLIKEAPGGLGELPPSLLLLLLSIFTIMKREGLTLDLSYRQNSSEREMAREWTPNLLKEKVKRKRL